MYWRINQDLKSQIPGLKHRVNPAPKGNQCKPPLNQKKKSNTQVNPAFVGDNSHFRKQIQMASRQLLKTQVATSNIASFIRTTEIEYCNRKIRTNGSKCIDFSKILNTRMPVDRFVPIGNASASAMPFTHNTTSLSQRHYPTNAPAADPIDPKTDKFNQ
jgi:hypothetical protein